MPAPPIDPDVDLGQLPWFPIVRARLFGSHFNSHANDAEWRAGVNLWIKSWDQRPSGSLPNDDVELCQLAGLGRALRMWRQVRTMALHGWVLCDDGRLYHPVVADVVNAAANLKNKNRQRTENARTKARENFLLQGQNRPEEKGRESPPKSPPRNGGDHFANFGGAANLSRPAPLDPRMLGHSLPCACPNCTRWAELQRTA